MNISHSIRFYAKLGTIRRIDKLFAENIRRIIRFFAEKYTLIKGIVEKILVATQTISLQHYSPIITSGKDKNNEGNYPLYGSTGIIGTVSNPSYNRTVVLVTRVGSVGNVQYVAEPCGIICNTLIIDDGEENNFM